MERNGHFFIVLLAGLLLPVGVFCLPPAGLSPRFSYNIMKTVVTQQGRQFVEFAWMHNINLATSQQIIADISFFAVRNSSLLLNTASRFIAPIVPTTASKWIFSKVHYSNIFSAQEKTLLLHESAPLVKLGQIAFLYDRHAATFNYLSLEKTLPERDIAAFNTHQKNLEELFFGLQSYYRLNRPESFSSSLFSAEQIQKMAMEPTQPDATVFSEREMAEFSNLPDLTSQQRWAVEKLQGVYNDLGYMQEEGKKQLANVPFDRYYQQKMRYDYLQSLIQTLQSATEKRPSLITRFRQSLPVLGEMKLTDAQRLGYERLRVDLVPSPENLSRYNQLSDLYAPYAAAEVFGKPYELALQRGANSIFLLSEEESEHLIQLSNKQKLSELPEKINVLKAQLAQMRSHFSPQDLDFYKHYYFLSTQLDIYSSQLKRAELFLQLEE